MIGIQITLKLVGFSIQKVISVSFTKQAKIALESLNRKRHVVLANLYNKLIHLTFVALLNNGTALIPLVNFI